MKAEFETELTVTKIKFLKGRDFSYDGIHWSLNELKPSNPEIICFTRPFQLNPGDKIIHKTYKKSFEYIVVGKNPVNKKIILINTYNGLVTQRDRDFFLEDSVKVIPKG